MVGAAEIAATNEWAAAMGLMFWSGIGVTVMVIVLWVPLMRMEKWLVEKLEKLDEKEAKDRA